MRKLAIIFLFILLLGALPLAAGLSLPRHVDPAELREEPPLPSAFFTLYSGILGFLASEDWDQGLAELSRAVYLHTPQNLQYIISRFNRLLKEAADHLSRVKTHIDEASSLIQRARLSDAEEKLEEARFLLAKAKRTVDGLESSATQLGSMLGASPTPLLREIAGLKALTDSYTTQIRDLLQRVEEFQSRQLIDTTLTIQVDSKNVQLGSRLTVWGFLRTVDGYPMASRTVNIYFDGARVGEVTTNSEGGYSFTLNIPYIYKDRASLYSSYFPRGLDFGRYAPASSNILDIGLIYGKPFLKAEAPREIYPGLSFKTSGRLTLHGKPLSGFNIRVCGLGQVAETVTKTDGSFLANIHVPPNAPSRGVTLSISAMPREAIGPASTTLNLNVVRLPAMVEVEAPGFALSGQSLTVKGRIVTPEGIPLTGSRVNIRVGEWSSSTISRDGAFKFTFTIPLTAFTAPYKYRVSAVPKEPWIASSLKGGSILIVNIFSVCAVPLLGATLMLAWRRVRRFRLEYEETSLIEGEVEARRVEETVEAQRLVGVQAHYWRAVAAVSKFTGIAMEPNLTIREYLRLVKERLMESYVPFKRLSLLYERWLYSPLRVGGEESLAEKYFRRLVEGLGA